MPQTTYNIDRISAVAGQAVSTGCVVGRYAASEALAPGLMAELHTDGTLRLYRGGKKAGIVMLRDTKEPGPWAIDDYVPVMREGTIWVQALDAGADLADANFSYKDTTTTDRGKATASAPSGAADAEVYDGGCAKFVGALVSATDSYGNAVSLVQLEVDFATEQQNFGAKTPTLVAGVSNDYAIDPVNGGIYEIDTTAAASTVSFPASTPDGTSCMVFANGTKNGHTLTFRDVATAISAATTASKRVTALAVKSGGKWGVTVTVGP